MTQAVIARIRAGAVVVPADKELLSKRTVARMLDVSKRTLERYVAVGFFPPPDVQRNDEIAFVRWQRKTVLRWIAELVPDNLKSGG